MQWLTLFGAACICVVVMAAHHVLSCNFKVFELDINLFTILSVNGSSSDGAFGWMDVKMSGDRNMIVVYGCSNTVRVAVCFRARGIFEHVPRSRSRFLNSDNYFRNRQSVKQTESIR